MVDVTRPVVGRSVADAVTAAATRLESLWVSADQRARVGLILERFVGFCRTGFDVKDLAGVTSAMAGAFVTAPLPDGGAPSVQLVHLRRAALRLLFRVARAEGWPVGDPTLDLVLPARPSRATRPLTDDEVTLCRASAVWSLTETRRAASWALAEATARTGELPYLTVADLDLEGGRVWLHGGRRTFARWGPLTEWGATHLARRLQVIGAEPSAPLVYEGGDHRDGGRVATSLALLDVLRRAGLASEPGVKPSSITAWAGRQVLERTGRIDSVALAMGVRSLDRAAEIIGFDWIAKASS